MNSIVLIGRLGKDPELKFIAGSGKAVSNFSIAVDRPFSKESDWFNIVAWGKTAESAANYLHKGSRVAVKGYIMTRTYDDKEGVKRYVTEVVADQVEFLDGKKDSASDSRPVDDFSQAGFEDMGDDSEVPF